MARAGFSVHEALAVSEVLALAAEHPGAQIVIAADVDPERGKVIQQHYPTLQLKAGATVADVIWELEQLSPRSSVTH